MQSDHDAPRFIAIEGPIRVGKTTLADILAERLQAPAFAIAEDNPFLEGFYRDKPGRRVSGPILLSDEALQAAARPGPGRPTPLG